MRGSGQSDLNDIRVLNALLDEARLKTAALMHALPLKEIEARLKALRRLLGVARSLERIAVGDSSVRSMKKINRMRSLEKVLPRLAGKRAGARKIQAVADATVW